MHFYDGLVLFTPPKHHQASSKEQAECSSSRVCSIPFTKAKEKGAIGCRWHTSLDRTGWSASKGQTGPESKAEAQSGRKRVSSWHRHLAWFIPKRSLKAEQLTL